MSFTFILQQAMPDSGPVYRETDFSGLIVEPWNAYSSLSFLIPAFIFLYRLRGHFKQHMFLIAFCCPMLVLGGLGSTLFHAFRNSVWLLLMDVLPIVVLTLGVSIYMWWQVLSRKGMIVVVFLCFTAFLSVIQYVLQGQDRISAGYFVRGTMLFLPCLLYLRKVKYRGLRSFVLTVVFFAVALLFRFIDNKVNILPMGTHFLWHLFCAAGAYELGEFLLRNSKSTEYQGTHT